MNGPLVDAPQSNTEAVIDVVSLSRAAAMNGTLDRSAPAAFVLRSDHAIA
jgi:hypothetical protein